MQHFSTDLFSSVQYSFLIFQLEIGFTKSQCNKYYNIFVADVSLKTVHYIECLMIHADEKFHKNMKSMLLLDIVLLFRFLLMLLFIHLIQSQIFMNNET